MNAVFMSFKHLFVQLLCYLVAHYPNQNMLKEDSV